MPGPKNGSLRISCSFTFDEYPPAALSQPVLQNDPRFGRAELLRHLQRKKKDLSPGRIKSAFQSPLAFILRDILCKSCVDQDRMTLSLPPQTGITTGAS